MTASIAARLFGPGVPATGAPAELSVFVDRIEVRCGETVASARITDVRIREAGFGRQMGLEFSWDELAGTYAVHVLDPAGVQRLTSTPLIQSSPQMLALKAGTRRTNAVRGMGWLIVALIVLLPLIVILVFIWQADRIAGSLVQRIPIAQEVALGEQAYEDLSRSLTLLDTGASHDAVETIGTRLTQGSRYRYRFHVAQDASINAFALPGGIIVVHTGLIDATRRPEELAGVLAHEIQHVEQRHSLRAAFKQLGLSGLWALLTGDVGSTIIGQAALQLTSLQFSRSDESSADAVGLKTLAEHGIDPQGMIDFFATMEKQGGAKPPAFLSTHPADRERQQQLAGELDRLENRSYPPLELGHWPPANQ